MAVNDDSCRWPAVPVIFITAFPDGCLTANAGSLAFPGDQAVQSGYESRLDSARRSFFDRRPQAGGLIRPISVPVLESARGKLSCGGFLVWEGGRNETRANGRYIFQSQES